MLPSLYLFVHLTAHCSSGIYSDGSLRSSPSALDCEIGMDNFDPKQVNTSKGTCILGSESSASSSDLHTNESERVVLLVTRPHTSNPITKVLWYREVFHYIRDCNLQKIENQSGIQVSQIETHRTKD